jgi:hypothetical protein
VYGEGLDSPSPRLGGGFVSVNMMSSLLVVARIAPASEDGVQLGHVKRPCVLTVREPAETSGAVQEPRRRQAATRLADGERGDERADRRRVLLHEALQGFGHPMDGMGWQDLNTGMARSSRPPFGSGPRAMLRA